jgi:hypothetical protein
MSMSNQTIWDIRDSVQALKLNPNEIAFLMIVESRGTAYGTAPSLAKSMGMSRSTFFRTKSSLLEKGLISVKGNEYQVIPAALQPSQSDTVSKKKGSVNLTLDRLNMTRKSVNLTHPSKEDLQEDLQENQGASSDLESFLTGPQASGASRDPEWVRSVLGALNEMEHITRHLGLHGVMEPSRSETTRKMISQWRDLFAEGSGVLSAGDEALQGLNILRTQARDRGIEIPNNSTGVAA